MKKVLFTVVLFIGLISTAQSKFTTHAQYILVAEREMAKENKEAALNLFEKAFKKGVKSKAKDYLNAAKLAAEINDKSKVKAYIIKSIVKKKASKNGILKKSKNELYQETAKEVVDNYNFYLKQFYMNIDDLEAYNKILKLHGRDQEIRSVKDYFLEISDKDKRLAMNELDKNPNAKRRKELMAILFPKLEDCQQQFLDKARPNADKLNIKELIEITKEHGWQEEAWMILWHQRGTYGSKNEFWDFFKPYLEEEIEKGNIAPFFFAIFEDWKSNRETGKTIYGFHPGKVDAETVNEKRASVGLPLMTQEEINKRNNSKTFFKVF